MTEKEFRQKFLEAFAKNTTKEQKKEAFRGGDYLWHIFSYGLIPCLEGDAASIEFDKANKRGAIAVHYDCGVIHDYKKLGNKSLTAKEVDDSGLVEYYIIGEDFSWAYVITHEGGSNGFGLGPYFVKG